MDLQLANTAELLLAFSWLDETLLTIPHVLEGDRPNCNLRLIRVDLGGTAEHVTKKCMQDLSKRQCQKEFNDLVANRRFVQVVLTASCAKQDLIQNSIAKRQWPPGMRFHVFVVPELIQFLSAQ